MSRLSSEAAHQIVGAAEAEAVELGDPFTVDVLRTRTDRSHARGVELAGDPRARANRALLRVLAG